MECVTERTATHLRRKRHDRPVEESPDVRHQVDDRTAIIEDGAEPRLFGVLPRKGLRDGVNRLRGRRIGCSV